MNEKEGYFVSALTRSALNNMATANILPQDNAISVLALLKEEERTPDSPNTGHTVLPENDGDTTSIS